MQTRVAGLATAEDGFIELLTRIRKVNTWLDVKVKIPSSGIT